MDLNYNFTKWQWYCIELFLLFKKLKYIDKFKGEKHSFGICYPDFSLTSFYELRQKNSASEKLQIIQFWLAFQLSRILGMKLFCWQSRGTFCTLQLDQKDVPTRFWGKPAPVLQGEDPFVSFFTYRDQTFRNGLESNLQRKKLYGPNLTFRETNPIIFINYIFVYIYRKSLDRQRLYDITV